MLLHASWGVEWRQMVHVSAGGGCASARVGRASADGDVLEHVKSVRVHVRNVQVLMLNVEHVSACEERASVCQRRASACERVLVLVLNV
jgi:hypothetical protein